MKNIDFKSIKTPAYIVDEGLLRKNLERLKYVIDKTGCKILLAQKAFSMYSLYPLMGEYLSGTTASSLHEAKLGKEEMELETHIYAPAYKEEEFEEIASICDHIIFNSFAQWKKHKKKLENVDRHIECGIRVNPEYSEVEVSMYDPCKEGSRFGVKIDEFIRENIDGIDGLHFHALCEQNSDTLKRVVDAFEDRFGEYLSSFKWVNFGGGHHITRADYDVELLIEIINKIQDKYNIIVYLEPGEAAALNTGFLVSEVLDIVHNGMNIAIMDASAACHMPDVLEVPYTPEIIGAGKSGEYKYSYRLGGNTCLAGDIIGDYSFEKPLEIGEKLVFCDMAHYSMVKNNTFNGIKLPSIMRYNDLEGIVLVKEFGYSDFKSRL